MYRDGKYPRSPMRLDRSHMFKGVSEGQFQTVLREELPQIRDAIRRVGTQGQVYKPKLTIAVAAKRYLRSFKSYGSF